MYLHMRLSLFMLTGVLAALSGPAYAGTWNIPQVKIENPAVDPEEDYFGCSVAVSGDTLLVGADGARGNWGSVYVFTRNGTQWHLQAQLTGQTMYFGRSVALCGDTALVGYSGGRFVDVFTRVGTTWSLQTTLEVPGHEWFGWSLSLDQDVAVVGASGLPASAYIFERNGTVWTQKACVPWQCTSLAVSGKTVAVARKFYSGVDIYVRGAENWYLEQSLSVPDYDSISLSGDTLVVGARVYQRYHTTWVQLADLAQYEDPGLDWTTALSGDVLIAGRQSISTWGPAKVFRRNHSTWDQWAELNPLGIGGENIAGARFGYAVAFDGETLAISARNESDPEPQAGAVYVFDFVGKTNVQQEWQVYR